MSRIFRLEWQRLSGFRFFWIFLSGYFLCILLTVWAGTRVLQEMFTGVQLPGISGVNFEQMTALIFYFSGFFEPFLALILIMMLSNDYFYGTLKQHVIDGLSYEEVVVGRLLQVVLLVLISFAMILGLSFVFAGQMSGEQVSLPNGWQTAGFLLRCSGYLSFAVLLVTIVKKAIPTVFILFAFRYIVEPALGYFLDFYLEKNVAMYLPLEVFGSLVQNPKQLFSSTAVTSPEVIFSAATLYFLIFWGAIYFVVKTKRF